MIENAMTEQEMIEKIKNQSEQLKQNAVGFLCKDMYIKRLKNDRYIAREKLRETKIELYRLRKINKRLQREIKQLRGDSST